MIDDLIDDADVIEITEKHLLRIEKYKQLIEKAKKLKSETNDKDLEFIYHRAMYDMAGKLKNEKEKLKSWGNF